MQRYNALMWQLKPFLLTLLIGALLSACATYHREPRYSQFRDSYSEFAVRQARLDYAVEARERRKDQALVHGFFRDLVRSLMRR